MDVRTAKLKAASFRGITFLTDAEKEPKLGRKIVIHDYPNSGKRFAQDLGPVVGEFELEATITGDNWLDLANSFKQVLNTEGIGRLVLPNLGALDVKAMPYSVDFSHKRIGVVIFSLRFTLSNTDNVPAEAPATVEDVFQAGDEARLEIQNQFEEFYQVPAARKDVITATLDYQASVVNTVKQFSNKVILTNSRIQNIVREVEANAAALIRDPVQLAKTLIFGNIALIDGLFATFSALLTDLSLSALGFPKIGANTALDLTSFGSDFKDNGTTASDSGVPLWPDDTANRKLRNTNRMLMVETVRINSLILAFEFAANFDYKTSDEISDIVVDLEAAYQDLILVGDDQSILGDNDTTKKVLDNVKTKAYSVLDQKAQIVFSTTELRFGGVHSVMNLTYKLYKELIVTTADLEFLAELMTNLNPNVNPTEMTGKLIGFET